jgi:hypothetical protein
MPRNQQIFSVFKDSTIQHWEVDTTGNLKKTGMSTSAGK